MQGIISIWHRRIINGAISKCMRLIRRLPIGILRTADDYRRFYFETARQFDNEADHKFAAEMYKLSLAFGENPRARGSLEYIEKTWFKCATPPLSLDHLKASCREHNISFGPSLNFMCDVDEYIAKIPENALSNSFSAEKQSVLAVWNSIV